MKRRFISIKYGGKKWMKSNRIIWAMRQRLVGWPVWKIEEAEDDEIRTGVMESRG